MQNQTRTQTPWQEEEQPKYSYILERYVLDCERDHAFCAMRRDCVIPVKVGSTLDKCLESLVKVELECDEMEGRGVTPLYRPTESLTGAMQELLQYYLEFHYACLQFFFLYFE